MAAKTAEALARARDTAIWAVAQAAMRAATVAARAAAQRVVAVGAIAAIVAAGCQAELSMVVAAGLEAAVSLWDCWEARVVPELAVAEGSEAVRTAVMRTMAGRPARNHQGQQKEPVDFDTQELVLWRAPRGRADRSPSAACHWCSRGDGREAEAQRASEMGPQAE